LGPSWAVLRPAGLQVFDASPSRYAFSPHFLLKTEAESSFRNVVVLLFYSLGDGQNPKGKLYVLSRTVDRNPELLLNLYLQHVQQLLDSAALKTEWSLFPASAIGI
jgi:hypothetical protein